MLNPQGALGCRLGGVEVLGRDISVVCTHADCENASIRAIISAENSVDTGSAEVRFDIKPGKLFVFSRATEERIDFDK